MGLEWLFDRFANAHEKPAIIWCDQEFSYGWFLGQIAAWKRELVTHSVRQGTIVALEADYSPQVCALFLALIDCGTITVPLTSTVEAKKPRFREIAEVQTIFHFDSADAWEASTTGVTPQHPLTLQLIASGDPGLVLFSSGSTGESKAALHNFTPLLEKFKVQRHSLRTITFLLLDHIGGVNTLLYVLSNLGTVFTVKDRSPDAVCAVIERHKVELLPTSPTFLNLILLSEAHKRYDLSSLKLITYGTEPMPESTLQRIHKLFPDVQLKQTYGLSELGILRSKSKDDGSLWVKVGGEGFETKIIDGILWIRAQSAMLGYLNAPSPFDADGWFNTGDAVEVDGEWIRILGRSSEIINVGGEKVYPAEVEGVLLQIPNIRDATVFGEKNPIMGNIVVARVNLKEPENLSSLRRRVREFCKPRLAAYKIPAKIEIANGEQFSPRFKKMRRRDASHSA